jgi:hypothetical protein
MTTTPAPTDPAADTTGTTDTDQALAERAVSSADFLAGILAAAMLDTLARPGQLPADLFPDIPEAHVQAVWQRALVVGYRAGKFANAPRFNRDTLNRLQLALADAGYQAMAALAEKPLQAVAIPAGEHPADTEHTRGEHW